MRWPPAWRRGSPGCGRACSPACPGLGLAVVLVAALAFDESHALPGVRRGAARSSASALLLVGGLGRGGLGPAGRSVAGAGARHRRLVLLALPLALAAADPGRRGLGPSRPAGPGWRSSWSRPPCPALTYRFVEQPFRRRAGLPGRRRREPAGVLLYPAVVVAHPAAPRRRRPRGRGAAHRRRPGRSPSTDFGAAARRPASRSSARTRCVALVEASVLAAAERVRHPRGPQAPAAGPRRGPAGRGGVRVLRDQRGPAAVPARRPGRRQDAGPDRRLARPAVDPRPRRARPSGTATRRTSWSARAARASDVTPWLNNDTGPAVLCEAFQDWAVSQVEELRAGRRRARLAGQPQRLRGRGRRARHRPRRAGRDVRRGHDQPGRPAGSAHRARDPDRRPARPDLRPRPLPLRRATRPLAKCMSEGERHLGPLRRVAARRRARRGRRVRRGPASGSAPTASAPR